MNTSPTNQQTTTHQAPSVAILPRALIAGMLAAVLLTLTLVVAVASPDSAVGAPKRPPNTTTTSTTAGTSPTPTASTTAPTTTGPATTTAPPTTSSTTSPVPPPTSVTATPNCAGFVDYAGASYCSTSIGAILAGQQPVGSRVVVPGAWVLESTPGTVIIGRDECPPGYYCGDTLLTIAVTVPAGVQSPPVDATVDVYGTISAQNTLEAVGFGRP